LGGIIIEGEPKHPSKRVINALIRRGVKVISTRGSGKYQYSKGTPDRGWSTVEPHAFYNEVEDDEN
jgi:hypothetical protein